MTEPVLLIGGGGHCRSCIDVIEQEGRLTIAGIVDMSEKEQQTVFGYPVVGTDSDLPELVKSIPNVLITLGQIKSPARRMELFDYLKRLGAQFPVILSPMAYVSSRSRIDEGTIVMHHALVNAGACVGRNCIINTKALVEHDAVIEDHCHVSTGAIVNGGVRIGSGSFFGSGAVSAQYTTVSPHSFVKANSLIAKSQ